MIGRAVAALRSAAGLPAPLDRVDSIAAQTNDVQRQLDVCVQRIAYLVERVERLEQRGRSSWLRRLARRVWPRRSIRVGWEKHR